MPNVITEFVRTYFLFGSKYDFLVFSIEKIENININININFLNNKYRAQEWFVVLYA